MGQVTGEEITTEAPQGFFGSLFGGSSETEVVENKDTANENTKYNHFENNNNDIPQEQPYENVVENSNMSPDIISSPDEKTNELKIQGDPHGSVDDQISSQYANNDEIKFYEPGDAPEYVSTENPANIETNVVQDDKPRLESDPGNNFVMYEPELTEEEKM